MLPGKITHQLLAGMALPKLEGEEVRKLQAATRRDVATNFISLRRKRCDRNFRTRFHIMGTRARATNTWGHICVDHEKEDSEMSGSLVALAFGIKRQFPQDG